MPRFLYQARDGRGEALTGTVQALSLEDAGKMLRGEGKFIVKLAAAPDDAPAPTAAPIGSRHGRVKRGEVIYFAHQLAVMMQTGVPLSEALQCCVDQAQSPSFKAVLDDVAKTVQAGGEFSAALRKYPKVFPPIMPSLVRASEVSGTMGTMLDRIAGYLSKEQATLKHVRGAMMYPMFMMVMAVGVTIFLLAFVLPRFARIYQSKNAVLPAPTRLLLFLSNSLVNHWWLWVILAIGTGVGGYFFAKSAQGKRSFDWLKLHVPVFKHVFTQLYISRACRTMGTMTSAGVAMLDMIAIVRQVTNNVYYDELWDAIDEKLRQGSQLSETLFTSPLIPRSIAQMIYSGEKSGRLGQVMTRVAEFTEEEFERTVKTATQFIEPVMIATMGGLIGFVAISLLLPIFSVGKVMSGN